MSFPEPVKARIVFSVLLDNKAGFAVREDDGAQVYLSNAAVHAVKPEIGLSYEALLIPNRHPTAVSPWFAAHVDRESAEDHGYMTTVRSALAFSEVWGGPEMADARGGHERVWEAMLDAVYVTGGCSKFVRFDAPGAKPVRAWYTSEPDAADVDVWEDVE